jgi:hypothetical protein
MKLRFIINLALNSLNPEIYLNNIQTSVPNSQKEHSVSVIENK